MGRGGGPPSNCPCLLSILEPCAASSERRGWWWWGAGTRVVVHAADMHTHSVGALCTVCSSLCPVWWHAAGNSGGCFCPRPGVLHPRAKGVRQPAQLHRIHALSAWARWQQCSVPCHLDTEHHAQLVPSTRPPGNFPSPLVGAYALTARRAFLRPHHRRARVAMWVVIQQEIIVVVHGLVRQVLGPKQALVVLQLPHLEEQCPWACEAWVRGGMGPWCAPHTNPCPPPLRGKRDCRYPHLLLLKLVFRVHVGLQSIQRFNTCPLVHIGNMTPATSASPVPEASCPPESQSLGPTLGS